LFVPEYRVVIGLTREPVSGVGAIEWKSSGIAFRATAPTKYPKKLADAVLIDPVTTEVVVPEYLVQKARELADIRDSMNDGSRALGVMLEDRHVLEDSH